jgi:NMD protein affecting ribosome stability and mRNA decay
MEANAGRPTVDRIPVPGQCPRCGAAELAEYPVLSTGGWFQVVKCQRCLTSVRRERWHRLGGVDRDEADHVAGMSEGTLR